MKRAALAVFVGAAACASPPPPSAFGMTVRHAEAGMVVEAVAPARRQPWPVCSPATS